MFESLGCTPQEYRIEIPQDAVPFVHPPRRVLSRLHGKLMETLNHMGKNGVIARVDRPTDWVNSLAKLAGKSMFSILHEKDDFWQIPLDEESSFLCTFHSYFGQYRFLRCPFRISSTLKVSKWNHQWFGDIEGVHVVFDDLITGGKDDAEHDSILKLV